MAIESMKSSLTIRVWQKYNMIFNDYNYFWPLSLFLENWRQCCLLNSNNESKRKGIKTYFSVTLLLGSADFIAQLPWHVLTFHWTTLILIFLSFLLFFLFPKFCVKNYLRYSESFTVFRILNLKQSPRRSVKLCNFYSFAPLFT